MLLAAATATATIAIVPTAELNGSATIGREVNRRRRLDKESRSGTLSTKPTQERGGLGFLIGGNERILACLRSLESESKILAAKCIKFLSHTRILHLIEFGNHAVSITVAAVDDIARVGRKRVAHITEASLNQALSFAAAVLHRVTKRVKALLSLVSKRTHRIVDAMEARHNAIVESISAITNALLNAANAISNVVESKSLTDSRPDTAITATCVVRDSIAATTIASTVAAKAKSAATKQKRKDQKRPNAAITHAPAAAVTAATTGVLTHHVAQCHIVTFTHIDTPLS